MANGKIEESKMEYWTKTSVADAMRSRKEEGRSEAGGRSTVKRRLQNSPRKLDQEKRAETRSCVCGIAGRRGAGGMAQTWAVS